MSQDVSGCCELSPFSAREESRRTEWREVNAADVRSLTHMLLQCSGTGVPAFQEVCVFPSVGVFTYNACPQVKEHIIAVRNLQTGSPQQQEKGKHTPV